MGFGEDEMGGTSDKLDAEMEKKDRRNTIQPIGICKAEDTGDCAEGNATNTGQHSLRVAEEADPAGAPDLRFDHRCRQRQAPRTLCIEGDEENRMRGNLPRMRFCLVHDWRGEGFPHS